MSLIQANTKVSAGGYEIAQSIRFDKTTSSKLQQTQVTPDGNSWTISFWLKRGKIDASEMWFINGGNGNPDYIRFETSEKIRFRIFSRGIDNTTTAVFRDPSAWYHFVANYNASTGAYNLWQNNVSLISGTGSAGATDFNKASTLFTLMAAGNSVAFTDGYLSEVVKQDNIVSDPTAFGEYNDDGVWVPIDVSGLTFGSNGFYVTGANSADLGADYSGNGNDFTSSGLTSDDQVADTPTDNYSTANPLSQLGTSPCASTFSDGNLTIALATGSNHSGFRSTIAVDASDDTYMEITYNTHTGAGLELGIVSPNVWASNGYVSSINSSYPGDAYGYRNDGQKMADGSISAYGDSFTAGDVIGMRLNAGALYFYKNGTIQNSGTALKTGLTGTWNFGASHRNNTGGTENITLNFGQSTFDNLPTGSAGWSTSNLPTPAIKDGSAYFAAETYSGNGSTQEINFSGNSTFQPDMVILKERNGTRVWTLYDIIRGATNYLQPSQPDAESSNASSLSSFDADGFTLGSAPFVNNSGNTYISYSFLASNTTASNTDGDIASTVSVSATAGISIINFTGNGSSGQTVGHGLGVTPTTVLIKPVTGSDNWLINNWAAGVTPFSEKFKWNANEAASSTGTSQVYAANSTTFTVGSDPNVNGSGTEYFAVAFVEVPGFLRLTSYQGNGSSDGPFISLGHKSRHFWIKEESSADDWVVYDTARDTFNVTGQVLRWDSLAAEFDGRGGSRDVDVLSNGLKIRTSNATINGSGVTYVVASWGDPFGGAGVAPATAR